MSPRSSGKPALVQRSTSQNTWPRWALNLSPRYGHMILVSGSLLWQVSINHTIDVQYQRRLQIKASCLCQPVSWSMAAILRDSVTVVVVRTRPWLIPLAIITIRKSIHGLPFLSYMGMVLRLAARGLPELRYNVSYLQFYVHRQRQFRFLLFTP